MSPNVFFQLSSKTWISENSNTNGIYTAVYLSDLYDNNNNYAGEAYINETSISSKNPDLLGITNLNITIYLKMEDNTYEIITLLLSHLNIKNDVDYKYDNLKIETTVLSINKFNITSNTYGNNKIIFKQITKSIVEATLFRGPGGNDTYYNLKF